VVKGFKKHVCVDCSIILTPHALFNSGHPCPALVCVPVTIFKQVAGLK